MGSAEAQPSSLVIKFKSFTGLNCGYRPGSEMLFIDRWLPLQGQGQIPLEKLESRELSRRRIDLPLSEVPETDVEVELYFRFYALHSSTSSDHYESELRLTQDLVRRLKLGQVESMALVTRPTFEPEMKRHCLLNVEIVLL